MRASSGNDNNLKDCFPFCSIAKTVYVYMFCSFYVLIVVVGFNNDDSLSANILFFDVHNNCACVPILRTSAYVSF